MKHDSIRKTFERFLRTRELKLTAPRARIFERVFATHEHFSAEQLYAWLGSGPGSRVSRATVYRTLGLLVDGHFIQSLDLGRGELFYEHITGHRHHDHMVCLGCGKVAEFHDDRIEALQREVCAQRGFTLESHAHRLLGYCRSCSRKARTAGAPNSDDAASGGPEAAPSEREAQA